MKVYIFKDNGVIRYGFTFQETPLSDESDVAKVTSFVEDFIRHRVINDDDLGLYEYEIIGDEHYILEKIA